MQWQKWKFPDYIWVSLSEVKGNNYLPVDNKGNENDFRWIQWIQKWLSLAAIQLVGILGNFKFETYFIFSEFWRSIIGYPWLPLITSLNHLVSRW